MGTLVLCKCLDGTGGQCRGEAGTSLAQSELYSSLKLQPHNTKLPQTFFRPATMNTSHPAYTLPVELRGRSTLYIGVIYAGNRCRVCAAFCENLPVGGICGGTQCERCPRLRFWLWEFARVACDLQDRFLEQFPLPDKRDSPQFFSDFAAWWWDKLSRASLQCERSLVRLGPKLRDMMLAGWGPGKITFQ